MARSWVEASRAFAAWQLGSVVDELPDLETVRGFLGAFRGQKRYRAVALRAAARGPAVAPLLAEGLGAIIERQSSEAGLTWLRTSKAPIALKSGEVIGLLGMYGVIDRDTAVKLLRQ